MHFAVHFYKQELLLFLLQYVKVEKKSCCFRDYIAELISVTQRPISESKFKLNASPGSTIILPNNGHQQKGEINTELFIT